PAQRPEQRRVAVDIDSAGASIDCNRESHDLSPCRRKTKSRAGSQGPLPASTRRTALVSSGVKLVSSSSMCPVSRALTSRSTKPLPSLHLPSGERPSAFALVNQKSDETP